MDSLEFECPLCNGLFNAAVTGEEVVCPHCDGIICPDDLDGDSPTNVTLAAKDVTMTAPLFPPGYKRPVASDSLPPVSEDSPSIVTSDGDVKESVDDTESAASSTPVPGDRPPIDIIDDDVDEAPVSAETDVAVDDLLPPDFHLDDKQIETRTDPHQTTEAAITVGVRVDAEPATVGRGVNEMELRSRTPEEKIQFKRNKNIIVWIIGALTIILTMILMLQFG